MEQCIGDGRLLIIFDVLQKQVYDLQQNLKYLQQSGLPLYPSQGATVDLWQRSWERIQ